VPTSAFALAALAACVHAGWNMLVAYARDPQAATAVSLVAGLALLAPAAAAGWDVRPAALPYAAASSAFEIAYFWLLASGYARAGLGGVYPLVRGTAPVLVLAVSVALLGARLSAAAALGVVAVGSGILAVRGAGRGAGRREVAVALLCGACLAGYTLVDKEGLKHAAPLPYLAIVLVVPALAYLLIVARARGWSALAERLSGRRAIVASLLGGAGMVGAYALTLGALRIAPAAPVSAVRESSVLIAILAAAALGRERVTGPRLAGAAAIAGGLAAIALA
jgi:drug/metabolite transporter (DMT)-like permease